MPRAAQHLLDQQEVATGVLGGAEQRVHDGARGVVDGEQQGEARASLLEPGVVAAVDLEQHPLASACARAARGAVAGGAASGWACRPASGCAVPWSG